MKNLKLILAGVIVLAALLGVFAGTFCGRAGTVETGDCNMEKRHFWYSAEAEKRNKESFPPITALEKIALLDTGERAVYSFVTDTDIGHDTKWDDVIYLGTGVIYSINGKIQTQEEE